jgi:3-isopropylmalate/(R)-2-methylmalate dehydratase large subunit
MGLTLSEKILARNAGLRAVRAGDLVTCRLDRIMATDITAPLAIDVFRKMGARHVADPSACILINDHFVPAKDIRSADFSKAMREFAREQGIGAYFEVGRSGICHLLVPEKVLVQPGELMVGADSHTCTVGALACFGTGVGSTELAAAWALGEMWFRVPDTIRVELTGELPRYVTSKDAVLWLVGELGLEGALYQAVEFHGEAVRAMPVHARLTLCNMTIEAGAKTGIVPFDEVTEAHLTARGGSCEKALHPDPDAAYSRTLRLDVSHLAPLVAEPCMPCNVKPARSFKDVALDQVFIGSCTNGSLQDLRDAASVLRGREVAAATRLVVTPGTQEVYLAAAREGLLADLAEAGAAVTPPSCGACLGGHMGVLGNHEVALATTSRNFRGRMGAVTSQVYLSNPLVAAASAVTGRITHPEDLP